MLNEKVDIVIAGRRLTVEMEGFTQLEVNSLAQTVSDRMESLARETKIVDTSKLAILTALELAAELSRAKAQRDVQRLAEDRKVDDMIGSLENVLQK